MRWTRYCSASDQASETAGVKNDLPVTYGAHLERSSKCARDEKYWLEITGKIYYYCAQLLFLISVVSLLQFIAGVAKRGM